MYYSDSTAGLIRQKKESMTLKTGRLKSSSQRREKKKRSEERLRNLLCETGDSYALWNSQ